MSTSMRVLLIGFLCLSAFTPANAQTVPFTVHKNDAVVDFPESITFSLDLESQTVVDQVTLIYATDAQTCLESTARQGITVESSNNVSAEWKWDLNRSGSLPPGVVITWQWEVRDETGETSLTDQKTLTISDPDFTWNKLEQAPLTVEWAEGDAQFGQMLVETAQRSLDRLTGEIGVEAAAAIHLVIYPSAKAVQEASLHVPDWTGGLAFTDYNTILMGIGPSENDWAAEVIPHELAHLVVNRRTFNCQGVSLPTWLSEGLAVYSEGPIQAQTFDLVTKALEAGDLPALITLKAGFAANSDLANLEYAQGGMVVAYLVDTYGTTAMGGFLEAIRTGTTVEAALRQAFGFDTAGLDQAWRASLGFGTAPAAADTTATPTPQRTRIPTLALWTPAAVVQASPTGPQPQAAPTSTQEITQMPPTAAPSPIPNPAPAAASNGFPGWGLAAGAGAAAALACAAIVIRMRRH